MNITADTPIGTRVKYIGKCLSLKDKEGTFIRGVDDFALIDLDDAVFLGDFDGLIPVREHNCWFLLDQLEFVENPLVIDETAFNILLLSGKITDME